MSEDSNSNPLTVLILIGFIASGKSTFATALQELVPETWKRCNQDELGNRRIVEEHTRMWLGQGKNVVVDRTNIDETQRAHWIQIAREFGARANVLAFETPLEVCQARLEKRQSHPTIDSLEKGLEVQARFVESYRPPVQQEGWDRLQSLSLEQQMEVYDLEGLNAILDAFKSSEANPMSTFGFSVTTRGGRGGRGWRGGGNRGWRGSNGTGWGNRGNTRGWRGRGGQWGDSGGRGGSGES